MSISYLSVVQGLPTGLASSATVTPCSTSGSEPASVSGATAGTPWESSNQKGLYGCLITYPSGLPAGSLPYVEWAFTGAAADDPDPKPLAGPIKRGQGATIGFYVASSTDHVSAFSGTLAATRNLDNAGFASASNAPVRDAADNGFWWLTLTQAETNAACIAVLITGSGADPVPLTLLTTP